MWNRYILAENLDQAAEVLAAEQGKARLVAGATDLILEIERGVKKGIETLIDITRIPGLNEIRLDADRVIHLGPLVTHNDCAASKLVQEYGFPLAQAAWQVGSPQIRNRGTIAGNLITASPANDTITPLMALDASVTLYSKKDGRRIVRLADFYLGVRKTVLRPDELLMEISFPAMQRGERGIFYKQALRQAQAISVVNLAAVVQIDPANQRLSSSRISLGSVAPTIIRATEAEQFLIGKVLETETIAKASELVAAATRPISDIRGSAAYRKYITGVIARRCLQKVAAGEEKSGYPARPVLLSTRKNGGIPASPGGSIDAQTAIETTINGEHFVFTEGHNQTLLHLLREEALMTGTKEGCDEGECGACTVYLDGMAVMSCMVPAPRAHGAEIVTVEGLARNGALHPVQNAFIQAGAVQCGYCTPGLIMSAAKLLEERRNPGREEIKQALTGNLCRCTGYYTILQAIEMAAQEGVQWVNIPEAPNR